MDINSVMKYRTKLIECGKKVAFENPDRLNMDEVQALTVEIFNRLNELDISLGFENHDTGIKRPKSVDKDRQEELFSSFIDWYGVIPTGTTLINHYVQKNYSQSEHKRVLCVGDGEWCHLGRKLSDKGYDVIVVDPLSKREFEINSNAKHGSLHVANTLFHSTSKEMINWADLVVGVKVPLCAEDLTRISKPAIFSISSNAEMYKMKFNGVPITSSKVLESEIEKIPRVKRVNFEDYLGKTSFIYVCDEMQLERKEVFSR